MVGVLIWNAKTCLGGNLISKTMGCNPPMLEEYMRSRRVITSSVPSDPAQDDSGVNLDIHAEENEEVMINEAL